MTTITTMDRASLKVIDRHMREALDKVAEDLGLEVKLGSGSYDPGVGTFSPKITFKLPGADNAEWNRYARIFGFMPDDFGRAFVNRGKVFKLKGFAPRSPKFPVLAEGPDGRTYKFTEAGVLRALGRSRGTVAL